MFNCIFLLLLHHIHSPRKWKVFQNWQYLAIFTFDFGQYNCCFQYRPTQVTDIDLKCFKKILLNYVGKYILTNRKPKQFFSNFQQIMSLFDPARDPTHNLTHSRQHANNYTTEAVTKFGTLMKSWNRTITQFSL